MNSLVLKARQLAEKAHAGQFRNDGKPYFTHVEAVAQIAKDLARKQEYESIDYVEIISLLHDTVEDSDINIELIYQEFGLIVSDAVFVLTKIKDNNWNYVKYLQRIKNNILAKIVKIADLTHNLSDLKPGNLRDKYELSKWFLEN